MTADSATVLKSFFYPPVAFAAALPGRLGAHFLCMAAYRHFACAGVLIGTDHTGGPKSNPQLRRTFGPVDYTMTDADLGKLRRGHGRPAHVYFAAGSKRVLLATFTEMVLERAQFGNASLAQIGQRLRMSIKESEDLRRELRSRAERQPDE